MFWIEIEEGFWKGVNEEGFEDRVYWRMNFWCGDFEDVFLREAIREGSFGAQDDDYDQNRKPTKKT